MQINQRLKPKQSRSIERVSQILEAATAIIVSDGISGMKTTDVAKAAGITLASLYRYFPNKEAIVKKLAEHHLQQLSIYMAGFIEDFDLEQGIDKLLDMFSEFYRNEPGYIEVWSNIGSIPQLAQLDRDDLEVNTRLLSKVAKRSCPHLASEELYVVAKVACRSAGAVLRLAMTLPENEAELIIAEAKRQLKIYLKHRLSIEYK